MKKTTLMLLFFGLVTKSHGALVHSGSSIAHDIISDSKTYNKCFQYNPEEMPENFTLFLDQFTCRTTKDPIEHCLCMDRIVKELTKEDKDALDATLKRIIMHDPETQKHASTESNNLTLLSGVYKELNVSPDSAALHACEQTIKELDHGQCPSIFKSFSGNFKLQKKIIDNKAGSTITQQQRVLLHALFKTIVDQKIDLNKIESVTDIYNLASKTQANLPQLNSLSQYFKRYFLDDPQSDKLTNDLRLTHFKRLMKSIMDSRQSIEYLNDALQAEADSQIGVKTDITSDRSADIFNQTIGTVMQTELHDYCSNIFRENAVYYCQIERNRYNEVVNSLDLNVEKYAKLHELGTQMAGNKESQVVIGLEGLYCSKLSDKIKENKDLMHSGELPKNCDNSLCKLVEQRLKSGVSMEQIQEELRKISNLPKTHEIKVAKDKASEKPMAQAAPVHSNERDLSRKEAKIKVEDVFASSPGVSKEKLALAVSEVKKAHPELSPLFSPKDHDLAQSPRSEAIARENMMTNETHKVQQSATMIHNEPVGREHFSERPAEAHFPAQENKFVSTYLPPRTNSTINMYPPEVSKLPIKETPEVKMQPKEYKTTNPPVNEDLAKLKEEYEKLKNEMTVQEVSPPDQSPSVTNVTNVQSEKAPQKTMAASKSEASNYKPAMQPVFNPNRETAALSNAVSSTNEAPVSSTKTFQAKAPQRTAIAAVNENHGSGLVLTNRNVYTISADELEMIQKNPELLRAKFKTDVNDPEIFTVKDSSGEIKYLKAIYSVNDKQEKNFVEFKEVDKAELCKARIIHGNCEVPLTKSRNAEKKGRADKRHQLYKVRDLEKIIEKSTQNPAVLNNGENKT